MIIILTGTIGTGKSVVAGFLQEKNFKILKFSDSVREILEEKKLQATRENMQLIGAELRQKHGQGALGKILREKIENDLAENYCLDGARNPEEILEIKKLPNVKVIGVTVPMQTLIERIQKRQRDLDKAETPAEIREKIEIELGTLPSPAHFNIQGCLDIADIIIENTGTIADLEKRADEFISR